MMGIYLAFDGTRFDGYKNGQKNSSKKAKVQEPHYFIGHLPVYDKRKGAAYTNCCPIYSPGLLSKQYTENWMVIDLHWPMRKIPGMISEDVDRDFRLAADGNSSRRSGTLDHRPKAYFKGDWGEYKNLDTDLPRERPFQNSERHEGAGPLVERKTKSYKRMPGSAIIGHNRAGMKEGIPFKPEAPSRSPELIAAVEKDGLN